GPSGSVANPAIASRVRRDGGAAHPLSPCLSGVRGHNQVRPRLMPLTPLLAQYDNVLLDLDGCVWVGDALTPGAAQAIHELRAAGKNVAFVTNDARRSPE